MNQYYCDLSNGYIRIHMPPTTAPITAPIAAQMTALTENPTPGPRPPRLIIGLLSIVILLECVFVKEVNGNQNQIRLELKREFKNIFDKFDIYDYADLFNRYLPTTYATSRLTPGSCPASFKFTDSGVESREQLDLQCFKGGFGNGNNFFSPSDTPHAPAIILNENNND